MSCGHNITIKQTVIKGDSQNNNNNATSALVEICETVAGSFDGTNRVFYTSKSIIDGTLDISCNGVAQTPNVDYWQTGTNSLLLAWSPTETEEILARYNSTQE